MIQQKKISINSEEKLDRKESSTAKEIAGQPQLWKETFDLVMSKKKSLEDFLVPVLKIKDLRIILTGAGSSAFIGESVRGIVQSETGRITEPVSTTDIITHPSSFFLRHVPTLMISFARSGNSPESLESIKLANSHCNTIFHLVITCNEEGALNREVKGKNVLCFILPPEANDKGLAMTGSFSSMLLTVILLVMLNKMPSLKDSFKNLQDSAVELISNYAPALREIAEKGFERVIFLGSGPLLGIARECQLKLQELTDGRIICKYDSFLGFRHGPRVVLNQRSLIVYLFSNKANVFNYERDLAKSIAEASPERPALYFGRAISGFTNSIGNITFNIPIAALDSFYPLLAVLVGQILGYYSSVSLGLDPDNPSLSGAINRVVQGVTIYSTEKIAE